MLYIIQSTKRFSCRKNKRKKNTFFSRVWLFLYTALLRRISGLQFYQNHYTSKYRKRDYVRTYGYRYLYTLYIIHCTHYTCTYTCIIYMYYYNASRFPPSIADPRVLVLCLKRHVLFVFQPQSVGFFLSSLRVSYHLPLCHDEQHCTYTECISFIKHKKHV